MSIAKKGIRLDELLDYYNEYLSLENFYYSFQDIPSIDDFSDALLVLENRDIKNFKIYVMQSKIKKNENIAEEIESFYGVDIKEVCDRLKKRSFFFVLVVKFNYVYVDRLVIPNEVFLTYEEAKNRAFAFSSTTNLLAIKRYIERT